MRDRETGLPKGIAFVNFTEEGPAATAIEELNGENFKGRALRMQLPQR